jgi:predicted HicB family RNase H-like nuclease
MPLMLKDYRGYRALVEYDADDQIFAGRIADIRDGVGFHAATEADLQAAFHDAVDDYIETCARIGHKAFADRAAKGSAERGLDLLARLDDTDLS